ncbi:hypothetical protein PR048_027777 [Dryococelus australis]|uniref:Uncharacterized protein n=1 Tax=Dryococelus australis TaxID=614101 RepID=A0ABQ9GHG3_9NEOP|nr:hypothetical protein PR048_027777 [Dryococelus australis]
MSATDKKHINNIAFLSCVTTAEAEGYICKTMTLVLFSSGLHSSEQSLRYFAEPHIKCTSARNTFSLALITLSALALLRHARYRQPEAPDVERYGRLLASRKPADQRHRPAAIPTCENQGSDPVGNRTRFALVGGEESSRYTTAAPSLSPVPKAPDVLRVCAWHCSSESIVYIQNSITPLDCQTIKEYVTLREDCEASRVALGGGGEALIVRFTASHNFRECFIAPTRKACSVSVVTLYCASDAVLCNSDLQHRGFITQRFESQKNFCVGFEYSNTDLNDFSFLNYRHAPAKHKPDHTPVHCRFTPARPPAKASRAQSPAGSPDFRTWELHRTMALVCGFSRGSPVCPALSFRRRSILTSITLVGYQDLAVESRPNPFTHSRYPLLAIIQRHSRDDTSPSATDLVIHLPRYLANAHSSGRLSVGTRVQSVWWQDACSRSRLLTANCFKDDAGTPSSYVVASMDRNAAVYPKQRCTVFKINIHTLIFVGETGRKRAFFTLNKLRKLVQLLHVPRLNASTASERNFYGENVKSTQHERTQLASRASEKLEVTVNGLFHTIGSHVWGLWKKCGLAMLEARPFVLREYVYVDVFTDHMGIYGYHWIAFEMLFRTTTDSELQYQTVSPDFVIIGFSGLPPTLVHYGCKFKEVFTSKEKENVFVGRLMPNSVIALFKRANFNNGNA